jgi:hydrogenase expression/formation protein HypE
LYLACEGRIVAVVGRQAAHAALAALRRVAPHAAMIGEISDGAPQVVLATAFGGQRSLDELEDDPLPRIC